MTFLLEPTDESRLDVVLASILGTTRSQVKLLFDRREVLLNGESVKAGAVVRGGERVEILGTLGAVPSEIEPEDIPLDVVYEDDAIAVVNKRQGMVVHPAAGHWSGTLVNALLYRFRTLSRTGGEARAGIVHRLDKDTSGLLVVAKTDFAHAKLSEEIGSHRAHRRYLALLEGVVKEDEREIETNLGRDPKDRKRIAVVPNGVGKPATTRMTVWERFEGYTLAEFVLGTGRTHQIRVHAARVLGHPVVGDPVYGIARQAFRLNGQLLHAYSLTFAHPVTGVEMTFSAPLPDYFRDVLNRLVPIETTPFLTKIPYGEDTHD